MTRVLSIFALLLVLSAPAVFADTYNFFYTGTEVTASGTLTTIHNTMGEVVVGINGFRNGTPITGIMPTNPPQGTDSVVGSIDFDNVLLPASPFFDHSGLYYTTDPGTHYNLFDNYVPNVFSEVSYMDAGGLGPQINDVQLNLTATPEPGFYGVLALGLTGLFVLVHRKR